MGILDFLKGKKQGHRWTSEEAREAATKSKKSTALEDAKVQLELERIEQQRAQLAKLNERPQSFAEQIASFDTAARQLGYIKPEEIDEQEIIEEWLKNNDPTAEEQDPIMQLIQQWAQQSQNPVSNPSLQPVGSPVQNSPQLNASPEPIDALKEGVVGNLPPHIVQGIKSGLITEKMAVAEARKLYKQIKANK